MKTSTFNTWTSIFSYLFALIGLVLTAIGAIMLLNMGIKALFFPLAEQQEHRFDLRPPEPPVRELQQDGEAAQQLTEQQIQALEQWQQRFEEWQQRQEEIDPIVASRQETAAESLAYLIVGLPVYVFHWRVARRERSNEKKS